MANAPVHKIRIKSITITIWENTRGDFPSLSINLSKSYKDKKGDWQETGNFNVNDLPIILVLVGKAYEWSVTEWNKDGPKRPSSKSKASEPEDDIGF